MTTLLRSPIYALALMDRGVRQAESCQLLSDRVVDLSRVLRNAVFRLPATQVTIHCIHLKLGIAHLRAHATYNMRHQPLVAVGAESARAGGADAFLASTHGAGPSCWLLEVAG